MLKRIIKKGISLFLAFLIIATTFFIFDPSFLVTESSAVVDVKKLVNTVEPTVKFYVPETIYLNPVIGTGSQQYSFQYFIDCDENGTLKKSATQTTGTLYFTCSATCSSISISWENTTVDVSNDISNNQIIKQTIKGGSTSVRNGIVKVTCTYIVDGNTYHAYAYTYMYYPDLDLLTGVAASYTYSTSIGNEPKLAAFTFITGVHYVGNTTTFNDDERGVSNYYDQYNTTSSKGAYGLSPLIPNWKTTAQFKENENDKGYIQDWNTVYGERTSSTSFVESGNGGVYFRQRERSGSTSKTYGGISNAWGTLYVDTSRINNFNQIPNLRGGFIIHYYSSSGDKGRLNSFKTTDDSVSIVSNIDYRNGDGVGYGMSSAEALSGSVPTSNKDYTLQASFSFKRSNSSTVDNYYEFGFKVRPVNKSSLRNAYRTAIEAGWQEETGSHNGWPTSVRNSWTTAYNNFKSALEQAGTILGKPYASATEISNALSNLNSKKSACDSIVNSNFAAGENTTVLPQVYFYVPETIYLNPTDNQTFQYFYGVGTNGTPTKNISLSTASSGAKIYFAGKNCTPTSVKITVDGSGMNETDWDNVYGYNINSISYGGTSFTGGNASTIGKSYSSFPVNIQCTAGKLSYSVSASNYRFLRWTAEYVVGGITYKTYAYTLCYSPYDKPAAAAVRTYNSRGVETDLQQIAWVSGIVGCNTNGNRTNNTTNFIPIIDKVLKPTNTSNDGGYSQDSGTYINGSSGTGYFENRDTDDVDQGAQAVAPTGQLILDSTRFSNLQYVPNFKIGFLISYVNEGSPSVSKRRFGYYLSDASAISFTSPSGYGESKADVYNNNRGSYITSYTTYESYDGTIDRSICYPRQVYNNVWNKEVTSTSTVSIKGASRFGVRRKSNDKTSNSNASSVVPVNVVVVNKGSLRSRYYDAVSLSKHKDWYAAGYDNYQNSILTMALDLSHPARSITNSNVNTKDLVYKTGKTTAVHLRATNGGADYNGNTGSAIIGTVTETKNYTFGDRVYGYYNDIPGFTKSSYQVTYGSQTKNSGVPQDSSYNNYYYINNANTSNVDWTFWYMPNTYNVSYDPNGGTYNGSAGLTASTVLYQSKYTVAKIGDSIPSDPTRPGCTFMGWKCSADGLVYQPGDSINWEFLEDVTFVAQWEYNMFNLYFDENHDKISSNLFNPLVDENTTYSSTAKITSTNDSGETITTDKQCNLDISKVDDGIIKLDGTLAGNYTFGYVPMKFETGKTYKFSNQLISGSMNNGCIVIDLATSDGSNISPRTNFDFNGKTEKTITITSEIAEKVTGYRFWIWHGYNEYITFNNFTIKPRIEVVTNETYDLTGKDFTNVFADYIQYNAYTKKLPSPTRVGYTFDGWYTKASGGTKVNIGDRMLYSDWNLNNDSQTLYAHWTINNYQLMYENELNFDSMSCDRDNFGHQNVELNKSENSLTIDGRNVDWGSATKLYTQETAHSTTGSYGILGSEMTVIKGHTYEVNFDLYNIGENQTSGFLLYAWSNSDGTYKTYSGDNPNTDGIAVTPGANGSYKGYITVPDVITTSTAILRLRFQITGSESAKSAAKFSNICIRDITDPLNYKASDSEEISFNKKFDTVIFDTVQNPLAVISRRGYTFNGWYQSQNTSNGNGYGTQFKIDTKMPANDVQVYAQWLLNEYSIKINLNADSNDMATIGSFSYNRAVNNLSDGSISISDSISPQQTASGLIAEIKAAYGTTISLPIPSRQGYTFDGWSVDTNPHYASLTNNGNIGSSSYRIGDGNVTITAHWTVNKYDIKVTAEANKYDSNIYAENGLGGSVQINTNAANTKSASATYDYGTSVTITAVAKEGYKFEGWYYDASFKNILTLDAKTEVKISTTGNAYYAKFSVQSYQITYDVNGATSATVLSGWYSAPGVTASNRNVTADETVTITVVYGSTVKMTEPGRTGYTFGGWEKSGSGTVTNTTYVCSAGNATLKAKWTIVTYKITYNPENGTETYEKTYTYETTITAEKAPEKTDYKFVGWKTTTVSGNWTTGTIYGAEATIGKNKYGNVTMVAQWIYLKEAEDKSKEYVQDETIDVITGVDSNGNTTSYKTSKYDTTSFKKYSDAINAYNKARDNFPTNVNAADYAEKLATATTELNKAIENLKDITLTEKKIESGYLNNFYTDGVNRHNLGEMNLNHYVEATLKKAQQSLKDGTAIKEGNYNITQKNSSGVSYQSLLNECVEKMAEAYTSKKQVNATPSYNVYENGKGLEEIRKAISASGDVKVVNYVSTAFGDTTYYCYTNKTNPKIYLTVDESKVAGDAESKVCYPTRSSVAQATSVASTINKTDANAKTGYTLTTKNTTGIYASYLMDGIGNKYTGEINGKQYTGADYYNRQSVVELSPTFTAGGNGAVKYVIASSDDSYTTNYAQTAALVSRGEEQSTTKTTYETGGKTIPTITIVVDYHSGDLFDVSGDQVINDKWLKQFHLNRTAGGARNWEFPKPEEAMYTVNDEVYGQTDRGSFTYTFKYTAGGSNDFGSCTLGTTDVEKIKELLKDESNYQEMKKVEFKGTNSGGTGYGYFQWWLNNRWSINYYPANQAYTYVHLVDRWGNVVDKVISVGNIDAVAAKYQSTAINGEYKIIEDGGSGLETVSINAAKIEILTDENSTYENNVYKTRGNTIRIKTGEGNKEYSISLKDVATNTTTGTVKSDENGIITLNVEDKAYENGVYKFTLNTTEINLYDEVETGKYIVRVDGEEVEEGESAELIVVTTKEVSKTRTTDSDGNTKTITNYESNEDGTRTWRFAKTMPAGEYEYKVSVKVGHEWKDEGKSGTLIFTEKELESGKVRSAEYDETSGMYKVTFEGRATKVQFVTPDGMTRTYTRYSENVTSIKTYDANSNEVADTARTLDHEVWLVNARLYSGVTYTVAGKFEAGWNRAEDSIASVTAS